MLIARLRDELSGYAVPRFVKEIAGQKSKTLIL
jgi:L-lysine 2,3-aminomutase